MKKMLVFLLLLLAAPAAGYETETRGEIIPLDSGWKLKIGKDRLTGERTGYNFVFKESKEETAFLRVNCSEGRKMYVSIVLVGGTFSRDVDKEGYRTQIRALFNNSTEAKTYEWRVLSGGGGAGRTLSVEQFEKATSVKFQYLDSSSSATFNSYYDWTYFRERGKVIEFSLVGWTEALAKCPK